MDAHMKWLITYEYRLQTVKCEEKKSASPSHNYFMLLPFSIKPELKDHKTNLVALWSFIILPGHWQGFSFNL